jgi:hypothetical protein
VAARRARALEPPRHLLRRDLRLQHLHAADKFEERAEGLPKEAWLLPS